MWCKIKRKKHKEQIDSVITGKGFKTNISKFKYLENKIGIIGEQKGNFHRKSET